MKVVLKESEVVQMIKTILEQVSLLDYTHEDFIDTFFLTFRKWLSEKKGDEVLKYPISFLLKKYLREFVTDLKIDVSDLINDDDSWAWFHTNSHNLMRIGKKIIEQKIYQIPSQYKQESFLQRYQKALDLFIKNSNIPSYVQLEIEEPEPYKVRAKLNVDFDSMMNSSEQLKIRPSELENKLEEFFQTYLGLELGSRAHGFLDFELEREFNFKGVDLWVKNVLNKKIKKDLKELLPKGIIKGFRFQKEGLHYYLRPIYSQFLMWNKKQEIKKIIMDYLESEGHKSNLKIKLD